jgi:hypothetical protein
MIMVMIVTFCFMFVYEAMQVPFCHGGGFEVQREVPDVVVLDQQVFNVLLVGFGVL